MSNTHAEAVPAAQPVVETPALTNTATEPASQNKRYSNVQKIVGTKAKTLLSAFHTAGEHIRGNINAALDGAGDAIAGRKAGKVTGRKSGEETSRAAPAPTEPAAAAPATTPAAAETNLTAEATSPPTGTDENRFVVGQFINTSFKRTATLVYRVGGTLRSKSNSTVDSLGNTLSNGKQRASRRFSRAPKPAEASVVDESSAPADAPLVATREAAPAITTTA